MHSSSMEIVTKLHPSDVLFGRGSGPNDHEGNIRFRKLVAERKAEYMATNHRMTKARIAREIVETVLRENGRFLKKIEADEARIVGLPDGVEAWTGVDDDTIMEKAKQALRQNTNKSKGPSDFFPRSPVITSSVPIHSAPIQQHQGQQQQQQEQSLTALHLSEMGYAADDLEPIPIPSEAFPGQSSDAPPAPVEGPRHSEAISWDGMPKGSNIIQDNSSSSRGNTSIGQQTPHSVLPSVSSSQLPNQKSQYSYEEYPEQNAMRPPASRARNSLRLSALSNTSSVLRWDRSYEKSLDMSDLMDSFSRTHLGTGNRDDLKALGNSTESMGTIEPIGLGSEANMSYATMNSSVFSTFRPEDTGGSAGKGNDKGAKKYSSLENERSFRELEQEEAPPYVHVFPGEHGESTGLDSDFMSSSKLGLASDASMSFADLGMSRRRQPSYGVLKDVKEEQHNDLFDSVATGGGHPAIQRDSVAGIEAMGNSSLNFLKGVLMSQDELPPGSSAQQGFDDSVRRSKVSNDDPK